MRSSRGASGASHARRSRLAEMVKLKGVVLKEAPVGVNSFRHDMAYESVQTGVVEKGSM